MPTTNKYDCSGWVTKYNIHCSDGRTIRPDAFAHMDQCRVPLVVQHVHDDPEKYLGYVDLEHRSNEGLYGRVSFNNNPKAKAAKEAVRHGDIDSFSIYANKLKQRGGDVMHGDVKEVSLVLSGANAGAKIDYPFIMHSGLAEFCDPEDYPDILEHADEYDSARIIADSKIDEFMTDEPEETETLEHAESEETEDSGKSVADVYNAMSEKKKKVVQWYILQALTEGNEAAHSDDDDVDEEYVEHAEDSEESVADVYDSMTDEEKAALQWYVAFAIENKDKLNELEDGDEDAKEEPVEHSEDYDDIYEGDYVDMKQNAYEQNAVNANRVELTHSDFADIIAIAKKEHASTKDIFEAYVAESFLAHGDGDQTYGIENIEILFPDAKNFNDKPDFIKRKTEWVDVVLKSTTHRPFSRIKTVHADITADDARAKGYTKGNRKIEEVFTLLKRQTGPTTVYKKQKLDRDDMLDITDFDVLMFVKSEMRMMLDEEIARAILIGDGRTAMDNDKIKEDCIRPVISDDDLYTIKYNFTYTADSDAEVDEANKAKAFIKAVIKSRKNYRGSGSPDLFITEDMLTACLLLEDGFGRALYDTEEKLRTKLRVNSIVTVPVMEGLVRKAADGKTFDVDGILVNLKDYVCGADKGGDINTFSDFDIDYNQQIELMETRMSGALCKPFSAIVIEREKA